MFRIFTLAAALSAGAACADEVDPSAFWQDVYRSYWAGIEAGADCEDHPAFCAASRQARCEELWFVRNQLYNAAGQCFASPLGTAMFDNSDCTTEAAVLGSLATEMVGHLRAEEVALACAVDTSRQDPLDIDGLAERMTDTPWLGGDGTPSGCLGWAGAAFALHSEPSRTAPQVGAVAPGDNLSVVIESYSQPGQWWFYWVTSPEAGLVEEGWAEQPMDWDLCSSSAG